MERENRYYDQIMELNGMEDMKEEVRHWEILAENIGQFPLEQEINAVKQPATKKRLYCSCAAAAWAIPASEAINKAWCSLCDPFKIKHMQNAKAANKNNYTSHNNAKEDIFCPLCMIFIFMIHNHSYFAKRITLTTG